MIDHDEEVPRSDAELLARLGRHGRAQAAALDPRLEALAEGRLTPDERAALEADAASDPALARALEVFAPLDDAAQARIADGVLAALGVAEAAERAPPASNVLPFRRRPVGRVMLAVVPLAAAAALAFFVLRPGSVDAPPVPGYALSLEGGEQVQRGDGPAPGTIPRLLPDSHLRLVLTPEGAVDGAVAVRAWIVGAGGTTPWALQPQVAPTGAVLIQGTSAALGLAAQPPGRYTLWIAVGRAEALPDAPPAAPVLAGPTRVLRAEVELARP